MDFEQIKREALELPTEERALLAELLYVSVDPTPRDEIERLWAEEAERRLRELEANPSLTIPADQVFRRAKARLANTEDENEPR